MQRSKITKETLKELRGKLLAKEDELDQNRGTNSLEGAKTANGNALNDLEKSKETELEDEMDM